METKNLVCPVCGGEVEYFDTYDNDIFDDCLVQVCKGVCKNCNEIINFNMIFPLGDPLYEITEHRKG